MFIIRSEKALRQLLEEGSVFVFKKRKRQTKRKKEFLRARGIDSTTKVNVEFVKKVQETRELFQFISGSGFKLPSEWIDEIKRLHPSDFSAQIGIVSGYVYKVEVKEK